VARTYRIRRVGGKTRKVSVLTVPADVAEQLDPSLEFAFEATEDGLLYRPVQPERRELPSWMTNQGRKRS
jgi:hypothetical protein